MFRYGHNRSSMPPGNMRFSPGGLPPPNGALGSHVQGGDSASVEPEGRRTKRDAARMDSSQGQA